MRPNFDQLPSVIRERILWDIDDLDYDAFESSHAECVHDILNGNFSDRNRGIVEDYYDELDSRTLELIVMQERQDALKTAEWFLGILNDGLGPRE